MGCPFHQPLDALAQAETIVGDIKQAVIGRRVRGHVGGRNGVGGVVREQLQPFRQAPFIEKIGFDEEKLLDGGTRDILHREHPYAGCWNTHLFQLDQKARIWSSSS